MLSIVQNGEQSVTSYKFVKKPEELCTMCHKVVLWDGVATGLCNRGRKSWRKHVTVSNPMAWSGVGEYVQCQLGRRQR